MIVNRVSTGHEEEPAMTPSATEEIKVGEVVIRFLLQGEQSGGAIAIFEAVVPAGARVPVAHSHDGYEETIYGLEGVLTWTVEGTPTDVGPGEALFIPEAASTTSTTAAPSTPARSRSSPRAFSAPTSSARSRRFSTGLTAGRPTSQRSRK
jgi:quercetin dioxygenase-like cupin family protein